LIDVGVAACENVRVSMGAVRRFFIYVFLEAAPSRRS
jgi:hypothetical protein